MLEFVYGVQFIEGNFADCIKLYFTVTEIPQIILYSTLVLPCYGKLYVFVTGK